MIAFFALIVSAAAGMLGVWKEVFIRDSPRNKEKVKIISTSLIILTLTIGFIELVEKNTELKIVKQKAQIDALKKDTAYQNLKKTYLEALKTGKIVGDISVVTKTIHDTLENAKKDLGDFSKIQSKEVRRIDSMSNNLNYPLPKEITAFYYTRFNLDPLIYRYLDAHLSDLNADVDGQFLCNNNILEKAAEAAPRIYLVTEIRMIFTKGVRSAEYEGDFQPDNQHTIIDYDPRRHECELVAQTTLSLKKTNDADNFKMLEKCKVYFHSDFINLFGIKNKNDSLWMKCSYYDNVFAFTRKLLIDQQNQYFSSADVDVLSIIKIHHNK